MSEKIDVRTVMTGNDGKLFIYYGENNRTFLAEIKDYEIKASFGSIDYQPLGMSRSTQFLIRSNLP